MRPRFLINLINQCLGFAVNLNHKKIEEEDIEKGLGSFSVDVLTDISYEIRDVFKEAENIMYSFLTCKVDLSHEELRGIIAESEISEDLIEKVIDILLWYGFLGLRLKNQDVKYIFNLNYNMQLLKGLIRKNIDNFTYYINPAFWPSLMIEN
jgi:SOS response regulatory protein OraA/RecX